jgi:hypothetical protein
MLNIGKWFGRKEKVDEVLPPTPVVEEPKVEKPKKPRKPKATKKDKASTAHLDKEQATLAGDPYIAITKVQVDPNDINNGAFELDWNDKFVLNLVKQGYKIRPDDTDAQIVDRWFQTVCRNIALEIYEQEQADPSKRERNDVRVIQQKDLGDGRTEVS